jgi:hypothetical protein
MDCAVFRQAATAILLNLLVENRFQVLDHAIRL